MSGKDESNMRRKQGDGGWVAAEAAAPAPQADRQNRVQCKCGEWFDQAEFESHGRTCGAGEMTAEQFWYREDVTVHPFGREANHKAVFAFAEAFAKQRVEQAERSHHKWPTIRSKGEGEELLALRAKGQHFARR